jgi:hypothetical protein
MPAPTTPGESFNAAGGGAKSTPPDFYSTMASRRQQAPPAPKSNPGDEVIQALTAVFEVFKKLEAKLGGKPDPNLDAAKDSIKKFVAMTLKMDPSVLDGGSSAGAGAGAPPPPPDSGASAAPPPPPGAGDAAQAAA